MFPIPSITEPPFDGRGNFSPTWRRWLESLQLGAPDNAAALVEQLARQLGSPDGSIEKIPARIESGIFGLNSILAYKIANDFRIALQGDADDPGSSYVYGTQDDGSKGWRPLSSRKVINFSYGDASPVPVFTAPHDLHVLLSRIAIDTAFDGAGASLTLTVPSGNLLTADQNYPETVGTYSVTEPLDMTAGDQAIFTIDPGAGATSGAGRIIIDTIPLEGN